MHHSFVGHNFYYEIKITTHKVKQKTETSLIVKDVKMQGGGGMYILVRMDETWS